MTPAKDEDKSRKWKRGGDDPPVKNKPTKEGKSTKEKSSAMSTEKPSKGKKGLFGGSKYIWWW